MSNEQPSRRAPSRSGSGAPMGSTVSIIIAVVAVVVGFLVLRNISDSDGGDASSGVDPGASTPTDISSDIEGTGVTTTTFVETGPSTTPPIAPDAAQQIIVANASGLGGAAGQYSKALGGIGFTMGEPTDATEKLDTSVVYYLPGGEANAAMVAQAMGALEVPPSGVTTAAMPTPPPITGAVMPAGATVLVMLGKDRANKALPITAGSTATTALPTAPLDTTTTVG